MNDYVGPISVVSAGAGTGKTWRLSTEYVQASHAGTSPARITATTFTVKAAAELIERVRTRLIQEGFPTTLSGPWQGSSAPSTASADDWSLILQSTAVSRRSLM